MKSLDRIFQDNARRFGSGRRIRFLEDEPETKAPEFPRTVTLDVRQLEGILTVPTKERK